MQRLRFISPNAQLNEVTVAAVNNGDPLVHNEIYTVSNELADELLKNDEDWRLLSPPEGKTEPTEVAQDEGDVPEKAVSDE